MTDDPQDCTSIDEIYYDINMFLFHEYMQSVDLKLKAFR